MPRPRRHDNARDALAATAGPLPAGNVSSAGVGGRRSPSASEPRPGPEPAAAEELRRHQVVDQATGMLMAYYGLSDATARGVLRRWAGHADLPLSHLATGLVEAGSRPSLHPFGSLRRILRTYALDLDAEPQDDRG